MRLLQIVKLRDGGYKLVLSGRIKSSFIWAWRRKELRPIYDYKYLLENRDRWKARAKRRRRAERYGSGAMLTCARRKRTKRRKLIKKQRGVCAVCGLNMAKDDRTLDHIMRLEEGGGSNIENLQLIHRKCHDRKEAWYDTIKERNALSMEKILSINYNK